MGSWNVKGAVGAIAATCFLASSTAASASAPARYSGPDPLAILSIMSGSAPAAVFCGAAVATAAQAGGPAAPGCVLPQVDAPPQSAPPQSAPPVGGDILAQPIPAALPGAAAGAGLGISTLLLAVLAIAGIAGLIAVVGGGGGNNTPVSPA